MDLRAACLGNSQCPQYFSRFFCCFLEVKSRLHRFFFQQLFFADFQVMRSTFGMKIHCLPDQGRKKRWFERIVLCGFIQKFFKSAAFFGWDLPQAPLRTRWF